ncbi:MAG TPA: TonB-dependent siderophore receptor, partial [Steroidobacteraceae bacterium]
VTALVPVLAAAAAEADQDSATLGTHKPLETVVVQGSAQSGYKVESLDGVGPLGPTPLLDTPFSINVMPAALIENMQISTTDDLFRVNPLFRAFSQAAHGAGGAANMILRGFSLANNAGRAEDGIHAQLMSTSFEDKEAIETLTGLSGFLYGPANVGGVVNYVSKRPTSTPIANVTVGTYSGSSLYAHADVGGPIDSEGRFGYRVNAVIQGGDTSVDNNTTKRNLLTAAFDWHITDRALLQALVGHEESRTDGADAFWNFSTKPSGASLALHPDAPDAEKNFAQPFTLTEITTDKQNLRFTWSPLDLVTLRTEYRHARDVQESILFANNNVTNNTGIYSQTVTANTPFIYFSDGGSALLDFKFVTGPLSHTITAGFYGDRLERQQRLGSSSAVALVVNGLNFAAPTYVQAPLIPPLAAGAQATTSTAQNRNWVVGDDIHFGEQWSALLGGNRATILASSYNAVNGALTSGYNQSKTTPSASLLFKPIPSVTTYATYIESFDQGQLVTNGGGQIFTNNGAALPPFSSKQYELGAKAAVGGTLLTAALFQIDRALQYAVNNNNGTFTYVQSGRQTHKGIEITATGRVTEQLSIYGGATYIDPKISRNDSNPALDGKEPTTVAKQMVKLYAEYDIAQLPGLTFTGGFAYTGSFAADTLNTEYLPAVTTGDVGGRYAAKIAGQELVIRLDVSNVTNKTYWLTPNYVGAPRTVMASAELKF